MLDGDVTDDEDELTEFERAGKVGREERGSGSYGGRRSCLSIHVDLSCLVDLDFGEGIVDGESFEFLSDVVRLEGSDGKDSRGQSLDDLTGENVGLLSEKVDGVKSLLGDSEPGKRKRSSKSEDEQRDEQTERERETHHCIDEAGCLMTSSRRWKIGLSIESRLDLSARDPDEKDRRSARSRSNVEGRKSSPLTFLTLPLTR